MPFQRELRDLAYVPRWSIVRVAKTQSVAEHSFYTAVYTIQLARLIRWEANWTGLLEMALWHDVEECFTGDMPGPVKHRLYGNTAKAEIEKMMLSRFGSDWVGTGITYTPQVFQEAKQIIRVASLLDDTLFLMGELQRGNEACHAAVNEVVNRLTSEWTKLPGPPTIEMWGVVRGAIERERNGHSLEPDK